MQIEIPAISVKYIYIYAHDKMQIRKKTWTQSTICSSYNEMQLKECFLRIKCDKLTIPFWLYNSRVSLCVCVCACVCACACACACVYLFVLHFKELLIRLRLTDQNDKQISKTLGGWTGWEGVSLFLTSGKGHIYPNKVNEMSYYYYIIHILLYDIFPWYLKDLTHIHGDINYF